VTRAAVLRDSSPSGISTFGAIQAAAPSLGIDASPVGVQGADDIERSIVAFAHPRMVD